MRACLSMAIALVAAAPALAQQVTKEAVPGVTNFARLETTVACGGATTAEAVPELKKMGFASIINLRLASEPGANVEEEAAAAKTAGIKYYHMPFNTSGDQTEAACRRRVPENVTAPATSRPTSTARRPTAPPRCG